MKYSECQNLHLPYEKHLDESGRRACCDDAGCGGLEAKCWRCGRGVWRRLCGEKDLQRNRFKLLKSMLIVIDIIKKQKQTKIYYYDLTIGCSIIKAT